VRDPAWLLGLRRTVQIVNLNVLAAELELADPFEDPTHRVRAPPAFTWNE
jgi:hypothetical protein